MGKKDKLPIVIKKDSRKGILAWLDKDRRAVVNFVWLNKDIPHGQAYQLEDIDKLDATLWFCDAESVDLTISVLKKLKKKMQNGSEG